MSADLTLYAFPDSEDYLTAWTRYNNVGMITYDDHEEIARSQALLDGLKEDDYNPGIAIGWNEFSYLTNYVRGLDDDSNGTGFPSVWIGQVSTLKAGLMGDMGWVPGPVQGVTNAVFDFPVITPALISRVMVAMNLPNQSYYGKRHYYYDLTHAPYVGFSTRSTARGRIRFSKKPEANGRYSGIARRQRVKKWLWENEGRRIGWSNE